MGREHCLEESSRDRKGDGTRDRGGHVGCRMGMVVRVRSGSNVARGHCDEARSGIGFSGKVLEW